MPTKRLGATVKPIRVNANVQRILKPVTRAKNVQTECVVDDALFIFYFFCLDIKD